MDQANYAEPKAARGGGADFPPLLIPCRNAFRALGIGDTKGWELIRDGHLIARKIGSRTLIEAESLRRFAAGLPRTGGSAL